MVIQLKAKPLIGTELDILSVLPRYFLYAVENWNFSVLFLKHLNNIATSLQWRRQWCLNEFVWSSFGRVMQISLLMSQPGVTAQRQISQTTSALSIATNPLERANVCISQDTIFSDTGTAALATMLIDRIHCCYKVPYF